MPKLFTSPHARVRASVFIRIQFEYLFTWHSSSTSPLSSFIYFLALRLLLVAISSDRWPKKLKKRADWMRSPREFVWDFCKSLMSNSNNNNNKEKMKIKQKERQKTFCKCHATHFASLAIVTCLPLFRLIYLPLSLCCFVCQCGCCCCFITAFWRAFAMLL